MSVLANCYVRGCRQPVVGGACHKFYGLVVCCACHWPDRAGLGRVLGTTEAPAPEPARHPATVTAPSTAPVATLTVPEVEQPF